MVFGRLKHVDRQRWTVATTASFYCRNLECMEKSRSPRWFCVLFSTSIVLRGVHSNLGCRDTFLRSNLDVSLLNLTLRYLVNYVNIKNLSRRLNSTPLIISQTKFEAIISKDVGEDRFQVKTHASRQILDVGHYNFYL